MAPTTTVFIGNYGEIAISGTQRITSTYYYANGQRVAMRTAAGVTYVHSDHLRSTSVTSGVQTGDIKYFPYGATRSGAVGTAYKFTGQRLDDSTGLYYYGARYYDAVLGRFIQADTIVPEPGNPQALNRYSYVLNNPLKYYDPSGHMVAEDSTGGYDEPPPPLPPVVLYIYGEMVTNAQSDIAQWIFLLNTQCASCAWSDLPFWWPGVAEGLKADAAARADAYALWGWMVRHGGPWDHKDTIRRQEYDAGRDRDYQRVGDWEYSFDTWSNIHYGYVGMAAGFSSDTLLDGAGLEQIGSDIFAYHKRPQAAPGVVGVRRFDQPYDQVGIQIGINLWNTYGLAVKPKDIVWAIQAAPGLDRRPAQGGQP